MIDWLLVARSNNYGLTQDASLLADAIRATGATADFAETRGRGVLERLARRRRAEAIVHIERVFPRWFSAGSQNWLVPNQERFPHRHIARLRHVDRVLAKSRHAEAIFSELGVATSYLGFTSQDRLDETVERDWSVFFHLAGANTLKGTEDILSLWEAHPEWPQLVLVQKAANAPARIPANVRLRSGFLDDDELRRLQNECGLHLCPSRAEGWGHHIVEGLSVGAAVVTTDAAPMNEHVDAGCGIMVDVERSEARHLGTSFYVDRNGLENAITRLVAMPADDKRRLGAAARARYELIDREFRRRVAEIFGRK